MAARAYTFLAVHGAWCMVTIPYGMVPMMENSSFAKEAANQSVAELSWLIVGLACTGSDSTPAELNGHARETTKLHILNIYSSVKEVVYHIMQVTTILRVDN